MDALNLFGWRNGWMVERQLQSKADRISVQPSIHDGAGPRGLLVRDPYASQILNGEKVWEIRGRPTQIRGPVVIVKSGLGGKAFGTVNLVRVLGPLEMEDLVGALELPLSERQALQRDGRLPYRKTYAYVFTSPKWFEKPIPYKHPSGAVTWVRLNDIELENVRYAASPPPATRSLLE